MIPAGASSPPLAGPSLALSSHTPGPNLLQQIPHPLLRPRRSPESNGVVPVITWTPVAPTTRRAIPMVFKPLKTSLQSACPSLVSLANLFKTTSLSLVPRLIPRRTKTISWKVFKMVRLLWSRDLSWTPLENDTNDPISPKLIISITLSTNRFVPIRSFLALICSCFLGTHA